MNEKEALNVLLNLIQEHRETYDVIHPDFLDQEYIESDSKSAGGLLVEILTADVEKATEEDGVTNLNELLPDILAYYRSFRWITNAKTEDVIKAAWKFIFIHEANHFDCDLGSLVVENGLNNTFRAGRYSDRGYHCSHEEALGQTRGKLAVQKMKYRDIAQSIESIFNGASSGYDNFKFHPKAAHIGFDEVVSHSVRQVCDKNKPAFMAHAVLNRKDYSHKILKVYIHYRLEKIEGVNELAIPKSILMSERADKSLSKIVKKDRLFLKDWETAKGQLATNPSHPSLGVRKFQGRNGVYEGRINKADRFLFLPLPNQVFMIEDIGKRNDLYPHG